MKAEKFPFVPWRRVEKTHVHIIGIPHAGNNYIWEVLKHYSLFGAMCHFREPPIRGIPHVFPLRHPWKIFMSHWKRGGWRNERETILGRCDRLMGEVISGFQNYDEFMPKCPEPILFRVGEDSPDWLVTQLGLTGFGAPPEFDVLPNHIEDEWRLPIPEDYEPPAEYQHYLEKWNYVEEKPGLLNRLFG